MLNNMIYTDCIAFKQVLKFYTFLEWYLTVYDRLKYDSNNQIHVTTIQFFSNPVYSVFRIRRATMGILKTVRDTDLVKWEKSCVIVALIK